MEQRDRILKDLYAYLNVAKTPEHNGLQVEGKENVRKIVFGVSANMALFKAAKEAGADMIITHHGLIWDKALNITGVFGRRVAFLIKNDINLAAYHLPLDRHPLLGNNARLAKTIGLKNIKPFGSYKGLDIGFCGVFAPAKPMDEISKMLGGAILPFGPSRITKAAIVSGGAHDMLEQALNAGAQLYITGSRDEYIVEHCREAGLNFIAMGHYNSEKLGIQALMAYIAKKFKVETQFIDVPNPF